MESCPSLSVAIVWQLLIQIDFNKQKVKKNFHFGVMNELIWHQSDSYINFYNEFVDWHLLILITITIMRLVVNLHARLVINDFNKHSICYNFFL